MITSKSTPRPENRATVERAIKKKPMTVIQISKETGLSIPCVKAVIRLLEADRMVHVPEWELAGHSHRRVAMYRYGQGENAPMPPLQTPEERAEKNRIWRQKNADRRAQKIEAERRARIAAELARPAFRHWMDVALFGEARA